MIKTDVKGLLKDQRTGAVSNQNYSELETYRMNVERAKQIKQLQNDVNSLRREFAEIRSCFNKLFAERENTKCQD